MNLHGSTALVTGGARRVGKAIALALAREGARVAITYNTSIDQAQATVAEIEQSGGQAAAYQCDQRDLAAIDRLFDQLRLDFDRLGSPRQQRRDHGTPARAGHHRRRLGARHGHESARAVFHGAGRGQMDERNRPRAATSSTLPICPRCNRGRVI